jgi:sugar lactone lactonase YvrE
MNVVLSLRTPALWPAGPEAFTAVSFQKGAVEVLGRWEGNEAMRIKALARAPQAAWPADPDKLLAALKADRALVRDIATTADGKGVVALLVDAAKNRVEVVRLGESGVLGKFGRCADQPGETDDALGTGARALAVDQDGNIWVATNAWGSTSVFQANKDGQPYEAIVTGAKGALKKFAPDGKLLGTVSLLETPMDLCLAAADGTPVVLTSYRHVSAYHGAMVREGVLVVAVAGAKRLAEIKLPGGSLDLDDQGRIWVADVAGHVACFSHKGQRLLDVASSPAPAVLDSQLPPGSPLPAVVRNTGEKVMAVLFTFQRRLNIFATNGAAPGIPMGVPDTAGVLRGLKIIGAVPLAVGEKGCWMARF